jgi:hypothetical protein
MRFRRAIHPLVGDISRLEASSSYSGEYICHPKSINLLLSWV